jgi:hypothetical protein
MGRENSQSGQAIVLIAIMLTVLIGMAAIAIHQMPTVIGDPVNYGPSLQASRLIS